MRCEPAFDLQGQPSRHGAYLNRVVLDRVEAFGLSRIRSCRFCTCNWTTRSRRDQLVRSSAVG